MGLLKKKDNCYSYACKERDYSNLIMYGKLAFGGVLAVGAVIAGPIMWGVADSRLAEYNKFADGYHSEQGVVDFMEENEGEEQLYSQGSEDNVVLSKNEWNRLKDLYADQIVTAQTAFEAGILTQEELDERKDNFMREFKNAVNEQKYVSVVAGEGILKSNEANLSLRNAGMLTTMIFTSLGVLAGTVAVGMVIAG